MKSLDDLIDRLNALADSLIGDDWNHPITACSDLNTAIHCLERLKPLVERMRDNEICNFRLQHGTLIPDNDKRIEAIRQHWKREMEKMLED